MTADARRGRVQARLAASRGRGTDGDRRGRAGPRPDVDDLQRTAAGLATLMLAHPDLADRICPLFDSIEAAVAEARAKVDSRARAAALAWPVNSP
ncbi:MAG: hypothetical protein AAF192_10745 [Pseudomonadota bacterium]